MSEGFKLYSFLPDFRSARQRSGRISNVYQRRGLVVCTTNPK